MQESKFDGNLFQLIGWRIVGALVTVLTLGCKYNKNSLFFKAFKALTPPLSRS